MKCVLCIEAEATTAEHVFKASIYRAFFGNTKVTYTSEGSKRTIKGSNNRVLKPKKNLCEDCNNARSRDADRALTELDAYIQQNQAALRANPFLNLEKCFSSGEIEDWLHVVRYFAKHLACQLDRGGLRVPLILREIFLSGSGYWRLSLSISIDMAFPEIKVMENGGVESGLEGVPTSSVAVLSKSGLIPETIRCRIRHCGVTYALALEVPEEETVGSARDLANTMWSAAMDEVGVPVSLRDVSVETSFDEKLLHYNRLIQETLDDRLVAMGMPRWLLKISRNAGKTIGGAKHRSFAISWK